MAKKLFALIISVVLVCSFAVNVSAVDYEEQISAGLANKAGKVVHIDRSKVEQHFGGYTPAQVYGTNEQSVSFGTAIVKGKYVTSFLNNAASDLYFFAPSGSRILFSFDISEEEYQYARAGLLLKDSVAVEYNLGYRDGKAMFDITLVKDATFQPYIENTSSNAILCTYVKLEIK